MSDIKSPFPGMDPYLERSDEWSGVHVDLIVACRNLIRDSLPSNFSVKIEGSVKLIAPDDEIQRVKPDAFIIKNSPIRGAQRDHVAVAEPIPIEWIPMPHVTFESRWLEIVNRNREVVTTIEILSPYNKVGVGFREFNLKRENVLAAGGNWVEIDLLRGGKRPRPELTQSDYCAMMIRADANAPFTPLMEGNVWLMPLREPLVTIGIPLSDGYNDVSLSLQHAIEHVYREGAFWEHLSYHEPPPPPKPSDEDAIWIAERLEAWQKAA